MKKLLLFIFLLLPIQSVVAEEFNLIPLKVDIVDLVPITIVDKIEEKLVACNDDDLLIAMGLIAGGGAGATGGGGGVCAGYELCQNFEGTGYDNSESWSGTSDPDYTTTVLLGSQSNHATAGETLNSPVFTASGDFWLFIIFQINDGGSASIIYLTDSTPTDAVYIRFDDTENLNMYGGFAGTADIAITPSTAYVGWFHIVKGTSAGSKDGELYIYTDTFANACSGGTCTRPALTESISNSQYDGEPDIDRMRIEVSGSNVLILDDILKRNTEIGNVLY